jgi:hypothetical protein
MAGAQKNESIRSTIKNLKTIRRIQPECHQVLVITIQSFTGSQKILKAEMLFKKITWIHSAVVLNLLSTIDNSILVKPINAFTYSLAQVYLVFQ